jgi:hypothetical protein
MIFIPSFMYNGHEKNCPVDYGPYGPPPRVDMGFPEMYGMNYGPNEDYSGAPR